MTMIERVMQAIEASHGGDDGLDQMNPDYDRNLRAAARAAIAAMREPTPEMVKYDAWEDGTWQGMIDFILEGKADVDS